MRKKEMTLSVTVSKDALKFQEEFYTAEKPMTDKVIKARAIVFTLLNRYKSDLPLAYLRMLVSELLDEDKQNNPDKYKPKFRGNILSIPWT